PVVVGAAAAALLPDLGPGGVGGGVGDPGGLLLGVALVAELLVELLVLHAGTWVLLAAVLGCHPPSLRPVGPERTRSALTRDLRPWPVGMGRPSVRSWTPRPRWRSCTSSSAGSCCGPGSSGAWPTTSSTRCTSPRSTTPSTATG